MAYTVDIPQASDDPSQSQGQILGNFQELNTFLAINHEGITTVTDPGKHKFLQMPEQSSAPDTLVNEVALFSRESTLTTNTELVFRRESNGFESEFTGVLDATNGWTRLPSGILLKWGTGSGSGPVETVFPAGATFPAFTAVFSAQVSVDDSSPIPKTFATFQTVSETQINVYCSLRIKNEATQAQFRYLVIGT